MPTVFGALAAIGPKVLRFFLGGQLGGFARIETDRDQFKIFARLEPRDCAQRLDQPIQLHGAEHRAFVVDERQDDRLVAEVIAEANLLSG